MLNGNKICVVLPAYNAEATLVKTYNEIPHSIVDTIILVDDYSNDSTYIIANSLMVDAYTHNENLGYGANQKTCYNKALELETDIVVMLHPDYQYTPRLITSMVALIAYDVYDVVLGSRILGNQAVQNGMPRYKYIGNRLLTLIQNFLVGQKLSEYHTGYRAYRRTTLETIDYNKDSDDFVFDNQILLQFIAINARIGEVSCPAKYDEDSSSISFLNSILYGLGCLWGSLRYFLHRLHIVRYPLVDNG